MKSRDIEIGMKVVPFKKSLGYTGFNEFSYRGVALSKSVSWNIARSNGQNFLYVQRWDKDLKCWVLGHQMEFGGDFFLSGDFEPYEGEE